jgi:hypothetical protein
MTEQAKTEANYVELERYTGPGSEKVRSVFKVIYHGQWIAWLHFPHGWNQCWRLTTLVADSKGNILTGSGQTIPCRDKNAAFWMSPALFSEGKLWTAENAVALRQEADRILEFDRQQNDKYARSFNTMRAETISGLESMNTEEFAIAHGISTAQRAAIANALKFVIEDTYDLKVSG